MSLRHRRRREAPTVYVGDHTDRLSRIPAVKHDPDDRQTREDRAPQGSQIFKIPVPLPRFMRRRRAR